MKNLMKGFFFSLLVLTGYAALANGNPVETVKWTFSSSKDTGKTYVITLHARIEPGWKLFSVFMKDDLPNSRVVLDSLSPAKIIGLVEKGQLLKVKDPVFDGAELSYFENEVDIQVRLATNALGLPVKGAVNYMAIKKDSVIGPETIP